MFNFPKDTTSALIESAALVTKLQAELEAARAEIERKMSAGQFVLEQLAAEQAKNVRLLDFIARAQVSSGVCCCGEPMDGHSSPMSCGHSPVDMWDHAVGKLLDAPSDTSALEAIVKKACEVMRERCAEVWMMGETHIRALPAVTLDDLT